MKANTNTSGFTLVESIITLFILTVAALGLMSFLISIQYSAEDNLYESAALTVALSTLEQMKGESPGDLDVSIASSNFDLIEDNETSTSLNLGAENVIQIPIMSDSDSDENGGLLGVHILDSTCEVS